MPVHVRKIINGKVYDTKSAAHVCNVVDKGESISRDANAEETDLYITKNGQFFIAGQGGGFTQWRTELRNGAFCEGEGLRLVTREEAREMMESVDGPVEKYFDVEEG